MTPGELITSAQSGDRPAINRLLMEHRPLVAAVVCRFVNDCELRKDVIQNIFVKVICHIKKFSGTCRFSTWLYRIALNECMEAGRSRRRDGGRSEALYDERTDLVDPNAPDSLARASSQELRDEINRSLREMPLDRRTVFSLFYFGGYSGKEIAGAMSISEANVFMKLKAARDAIKRSLSAGGWSV